MEMTGQEVCGHVDVKMPSKGRKFGLWKAWRKQWCIIHHSESNLLQLSIGNGPHSVASSIDIPHNAVLCRSQSRSREFAFGIFCWSGAACSRRPIVFLSGRSESESQRWMMHIRNLISPPLIPVGEEEWSVSLIDNSHSRTAGLAGLYGLLRVSPAGVSIRDPAKGQRRAHWRWPQLAGVTLALAEAPDDTDRVIVLNTSSEFSCGEGELRLYCGEGGRALESALSQCRAKPAVRLTNSPLPPLPSASAALLAARRLSRSEGDLRLWPPPDAASDSVHPLFHLRTSSVSRHTPDKVASGLINAGLGLMLTTPGCSEPDSLNDHYQCLDSIWPEDTLSPLRQFPRNAYQTNRRESGVSVASGIYEEIAEQPDECCQQERSDIMNQPSTAPSLSPPPLPPRLSESSQENNVPEELIYSVPNENEDDEEPLYLPMSSGSSKENTYVVMANLIKKTHISEPVV